MGTRTYINHGMSKTKLAAVFASMKQRCNNPKDISYHNYGGRGITVCSEWSNNHSLFFKWALSNGYKEGLTIERKNNDGNYEPNNCKFITRIENLQNRRCSVLKRISEDILSDAIECYYNSDATAEEISSYLGIARTTFTKMLKQCDGMLSSKNSNQHIKRRQ